MKSITHREYETWMRWLDDQWNQPSLIHHYLMQIACEVRRVLSKRPNEIRLKHFLLRWKSPKEVEEDRVKNIEVQSQIAKARWFGWLGISPDKYQD